MSGSQKSGWFLKIKLNDMNTNDVKIYRDPRDSTKHLKLRDEVILKGELDSACLEADDGYCFYISDGIADLTWPDELAAADLESKAVYESLAGDYDKFADIPFKTFKSDEVAVRQKMIGQLFLSPNQNVLEVGCGTARGSQLIADRLSEGKLYLQEISPKLMAVAIDKMSQRQGNFDFSIGNASYLPFADNSFDALHHFGGLNTFAELKRFFSEAVRVVRPGGRVVVGDEGMGPWLKESTFAKIMENSNPLLKCSVPIESLPVEVRDVNVQWIMLGAYYVLSFTVADAEPEADYHVHIPSARGGSHWSRYYGQLEGVSDEAKKLAYEAQKKSGLSMTQWLNDVVSNAANSQLDE